MIVKPNFANRLLWFIHLHPARRPGNNKNDEGDQLNELNNRHANRVLFGLVVLAWGIVLYVLWWLR